MDKNIGQFHHGSLTPEKSRMLSEHVAMFRKAFRDYCGEGLLSNPGLYKDYGDELKMVLFEDIISNYFSALFVPLKKLALYDRKNTAALIEAYEEFLLIAPINKEKDYLTPVLFDLCMFLHEAGETEYLAFFYNLLIYGREIPFLRLEEDAFDCPEEEDEFSEFRSYRKERLSWEFDDNFFKKSYEKFFQILSGWKDKSDGYYAEDETAFMEGLFIADELKEYVFFMRETELDAYPVSSDTSGNRANNHKNRFGGKGKARFSRIEKCETSRYIDMEGSMTLMEFSDVLEKALKLFEKAIKLNPGNPRYYYEYARCLKNSGKSEEADLFFKKAFDIAPKG